MIPWEFRESYVYMRGEVVDTRCIILDCGMCEENEFKYGREAKKMVGEREK